MQNEFFISYFDAIQPLHVFLLQENVQCTVLKLFTLWSTFYHVWKLHCMHCTLS